MQKPQDTDEPVSNMDERNGGVSLYDPFSFYNNVSEVKPILCMNNYFAMSPNSQCNRMQNLPCILHSLGSINLVCRKIAMMQGSCARRW